MKKTEIEGALQTAFLECARASIPLSDRQKQILLQLVVEELLNRGGGEEEAGENPLDELTFQEREALLAFVREQEKENSPWKIQLLNDWLHNRNSGSVQFIREKYGPQWLNRVKPVHLAHYFEQLRQEGGLKLKVGDRIEVSNRLWEWVPQNQSDTEEWFPCTVVGLSETLDRDCTYTNCIIRFENGAEFEIQGIYQWNRYNWRWRQ